MSRRSVGLIVIGVTLLLRASFFAHALDTLPYRNADHPIDQRVNDLLGRMTLEEKVSQLVNDAHAIPRLNIPAYNWWSESLHGVASDGTTEFPEPILGGEHEGT